MSEAAPPSPQQVALHGLCPRCGAKTLFAGWVTFASRCSSCGLDFAAFNVGDGASVFVTLIVGTLVVALAVAMAAMSAWAFLALLVPLALAGVFASLRIAKAALIALEYRHDAGEGRRRNRP